MLHLCLTGFWTVCIVSYPKKKKVFDSGIWEAGSCSQSLVKMLGDYWYGSDRKSHPQALDQFKYKVQKPSIHKICISLVLF
jgi:hypothetical protein